jgi:hypothetical protein
LRGNGLIFYHVYLICLISNDRCDFFLLFCRDICDSLRIIETLVPSTGALTESEAMDIYRKLYPQSGPVLRLLQSLLMVLSRAAAEQRGQGVHAVTGRYPVLPCTFLLLYPVLRGILMLHHTMPGTEHTFHLLDR